MIGQSRFVQVIKDQIMKIDTTSGAEWGGAYLLKCRQGVHRATTVANMLKSLLNNIMVHGDRLFNCMVYDLRLTHPNDVNTFLSKAEKWTQGVSHASTKNLW